MFFAEPLTNNTPASSVANNCAMRSSRHTQSSFGLTVESAIAEPESALTVTHSDHSPESASMALYPSAASSQVSVDLPVPDIPVSRTLFTLLSSDSNYAKLPWLYPGFAALMDFERSG